MARIIFKFKEKVLEIVPLSPTQGVTIGRHHTNIVTIFINGGYTSTEYSISKNKIITSN